MIDDKCIESLIHKYFQRENILVNHQIESYNDYIDNILPNILSQYFPLTINFNDKVSTIQKITLRIIAIDVDKPHYTENNGCSGIMTPNIARTRNYTYSAPIYLDIGVIISIYQDDIIVNKPEKIIPKVMLGNFPIIVKSKFCVSKTDILSECKYDVGGYAIINGNEKVLITQEKIIPNIIQVYHNSKNTSKFGYISEVRSCNEKIFGPTKTISVKITRKKNNYENKIYISFPHIKQEVPIFVLFKL